MVLFGVAPIWCSAPSLREVILTRELGYRRTLGHPFKRNRKFSFGVAIVV